MTPGTLKRRTELVSSGSAEVQGEDLLFLSDCHFGSVSNAASVLAGMSLSGRIAWKNTDEVTYQQLEDKAS